MILGLNYDADYHSEYYSNKCRNEFCIITKCAKQHFLFYSQ